MAAQDRVTQNNDDSFIYTTVLVQYNKLCAFVQWLLLNRPAWNVSTAAVAPPVCATATTTSKVKTTNTTQMFINGVVLSLTGTDNLWTLTGGNLAAGFVRRYLLLWDGTSATTVVTVQQCTADVAIGSSSATALAACRFLEPPAAVGIVGILSIVNTTNPFVPGTTLLGATGVTATYVDGADLSVMPASLVIPN